MSTYYASNEVPNQPKRGALEVCQHTRTVEKTRFWVDECVDIPTISSFSYKKVFFPHRENVEAEEKKRKNKKEGAG